MVLKNVSPERLRMTPDERQELGEIIASLGLGMSLKQRLAAYYSRPTVGGATKPEKEVKTMTPKMNASLQKRLDKIDAQEAQHLARQNGGKLTIVLNHYGGQPVRIDPLAHRLTFDEFGAVKAHGRWIEEYASDAERQRLNGITLLSYCKSASRDDSNAPLNPHLATAAVKLQAMFGEVSSNPMLAM